VKVQAHRVSEKKRRDEGEQKKVRVYVVPCLDRVRKHTESIIGTAVKETNQETHHHDKHGVWHPCCVMSEKHIANEPNAETAEWEQETVV